MLCETKKGQRLHAHVLIATYGGAPSAVSWTLSAVVSGLLLVLRLDQHFLARLLVWRSDQDLAMPDFPRAGGMLIKLPMIWVYYVCPL